MNTKPLALLASAALSFTIPTTIQAEIWKEMDYGRFFSASYDNPEGGNTLSGKGATCDKGIAAKLGNSEGGMLFDTDLCRMAGGWTGGWIRYRGIVFSGDHGPNPSAAENADLFFQSNPKPTWSKGGDLKDPRALPKGPGAATVPFGPLPKDWAKYKGLYLHGDNVVFSYTVGTAHLLELPGLEKSGDLSLITRTLNVVAPGVASSNLLFEREGAKAEVKDGVAIVSPKGGDSDERVVIAAVGAPVGAKFEVKENVVIFHSPAFVKGQNWKLVYAKGKAADEAKLISAANGAAAPQDLLAFTKGGPAHWTQPVETNLKAATETDAAYVVDTVEIPFENPYKSWMRIGGVDFFKDGRIAVSTESGDVWIVSGVNKEFVGKATWKRYATGLFQALGLRIVNDQVYVLGRDQITRLHDTNNDGEADFYENFNNDVQVTPGFHEFTFDLQTDSKGNFYFSKGGPVNPGGRGWGPLSDHNGCIFKVSKDGSKFEIFATGVRAPNGISVGPGDVVTTGDNEGTWVPKSYVRTVKPGDFITVVDLAHREPTPTTYTPHICFFPMDVDNSGGGQVWVPSNSWGLPQGSLLHLSYGQCSLYRIVYEVVDGVQQGGAIKIPVKFESGTLRARFSPVDGQLYVIGLKGWQTSGAKDACLQRVRYTGKPHNIPSSLNVTKEGIHISFPHPLKADLAADAASYSVHQWNYKWSSDYGSKDYKVSDGSEGQDEVQIKSAKLSPDKKSVLLEIDGVKPVMQMKIKMDLESENGATVPDQITSTINTVPGTSKP